jgi:hypothetical protein
MVMLQDDLRGYIEQRRPRTQDTSIVTHGKTHTIISNVRIAFFGATANMVNSRASHLQVCGTVGVGTVTTCRI